MNHRAFLGRAHFPELDGLRGVCVLLVISVHLYAHKAYWAWLAGAKGVAVFFVLSGFLITTLALREEDRTGRLSLAGFFLRRAFRLLPLYYLVLAVYAAYLLVLGQGTAEQRSAFAEALPWYALYLQEVPFFTLLVAGQRDLPFFHSWSLGVEEKFYLAWPVVAFVLWRAKAHSRLVWTVGAVAALTVALPAALPFARQAARYLVSYQAILAGCALAMLMHRRDTFDRVARWGRVWPLVAVHFLSPWAGEWLDTAYPLACCLALVALLTRGSPLLSAGPLVQLGRLSYGVYLVHLLAMAAVYRALPFGSWHPATSVTAFALVSGLSFAAAWPLYVWVEQPLIRLGRRLATAPTPVPAAMMTVDRSPEAVACTAGSTYSLASSR
ncbi:MAG: acyltransferase family protein [Gemmataceae bacterium]